MTNVIEVTNYQKAYQNEVAVDGLSFNVKAGQVVGLIGPNGSGKTTTLRAIAGIIPPSGGTLKVQGVDVLVDPIAVKKCTAYVPDDPQLFNDLTVDQHFAFVASIYGIKNWQDQMLRIVERFELTNRLKSRASELSRGMRQKLAIGCAYLYQPKALLLDEPMTGLDPSGIRVLKETICEHAEAGSAIMISSHLLAMVEDICTDVLILAEGKSRFFGEIEALKREFAQTHGSSSLEDMFFQTITN